MRLPYHPRGSGQRGFGPSDAAESDRGGRRQRGGTANTPSGHRIMTRSIPAPDSKHPQSGAGHRSVASAGGTLWIAACLIALLIGLAFQLIPSAAIAAEVAPRGAAAGLDSAPHINPQVGPTDTPTPSDTPTATDTATDTPTAPTDTPTPSETPTPADTPTTTDTPAPTDTPTATATPVERISPATQTAAVSDAVTTDITVEDVIGLGAYDAVVTYDSALIQFDSALDGAFLSSTGRTTSCSAPDIQPVLGTINQVTFSCQTFGASPPGPDGAGTLATMHWTALAPGTATLSLAPSLADIGGAPIPASAVLGDVVISAADTPTPTDTAVATATDTPTPTDTAVATATDTPVPTATDTATPPATDTATATPTDTPVPTATDTPTPTDTALPTATETPTSTDTATATDTPTPTQTPAPDVCGSPGTAVCVLPSSQTQTNSSSAEIDVVVQNVDDLGAFEFTLSYDPSLLSVASVSPGAFLGSTGRAPVCPTAVVDVASVQFSCSSLGAPTPAGPSGNGILASITFNTDPTATGATPLLLSGVTLTKVSCAPGACDIPATAVNGSVTVQPCGGPCPTATPTSSPTDTPTSTETHDTNANRYTG